MTQSTTTALRMGPWAQRLTLPIREIFGPVPQGEGPYVGRRSVFVRTGAGCNLHCPPCDTKETWDRDQFDIAALAPPMLAADVVRRAVELGAGDAMTVVTGGEPLLWQMTQAWDVFLDLIPGFVQMETNGTIPPTEETAARIDHFVVSPKIGAMGAADPEKRRIVPKALARFNMLAAQDKATYKFVAGTPADVDDVVALVGEHRIPRHRVYVMPLGAGHDEARANGRAIVDTVMARGFNITTRLHLELGVR
ncbi:7-carboxy-7-deazaguanine synthase QueE [Streptomyces sp. NPDC049879]|uniref:7-carboxy-7-deazaguanine synthase QueE n=1 Tax=Streptomyces sp. NPDC049879 TaxID=3365598 RepID=UPI0037B2E1FC